MIINIKIGRNNFQKLDEKIYMNLNKCNILSLKLII